MLDQLGAALTPQPQLAQPDPNLKGQWDGWLQNPANRAGLLSFGLQLMTGGWGGAGSQLAQAMGAGVEAAAGTQEVFDAERRQREERSFRAGENQKDRDLRAQLNKEDNAAAMDRTRAGMGASKEQARQDRLQLAYDRQEERELKEIEKLEQKIAEAEELGMGGADTLRNQLKTRMDRLAAVRQKRDELLGMRSEEGPGAVDVGPETSVNPPAGGESVLPKGDARTGVETSKNSAAPISAPKPPTSSPQVNTATWLMRSLGLTP